MRMDWTREVLLVTGATSGLGRALALEMGRRGGTVALIARRADRLQAVAAEVDGLGGKAHPFVHDLADVEAIPERYRQIRAALDTPPTILINNVGYQVAGFVQNTPTAVYAENMRVNFLAPVALIQCVLPEMLSQGRGVIGNVMSSIMYHAFPGVSSYAASKSALGAMHESLQLELSGKPVRTLIIRPGSFRSDYWKNTRLDDRIPGLQLPTGEGGRDPARVAKVILDAVEQGRDEVNLSTFKDHVGRQLGYWAPRLLRWVIARNNQKIISRYPGDDHAG